METLLYYTILNLQPDADIPAIKRAYRQLSRKNNSDNVSESGKGIQKLKMMQINEAYHYLTNHLTQMNDDIQIGQSKKKYCEKSKYDPASQDRIKRRYKNNTTINDLDASKEPAYACYRHGFLNFSKALYGIMPKESNESSTDSGNIIEWANKSIQYFQRAHTYFSRVVSEYPDSLWYDEAVEKLYRIQNFNSVYFNILTDIKSRLGEEFF